MTEPWLLPLDFQAYLEAKLDVDSASLNPALFDRFRSSLEAISSPRVLDLGTGTGAMLRRLLGFTLCGRAELYGLDSDGYSLELAYRKTASLLEERGWQVHREGGVGEEQALWAQWAGRQLSVRLLFGDLLGPGLLEQLRGGRFHAVAAHAVMDMLPLDRGLEVIRRLLTEGGLFYATINYDGLTVLLPPYAFEGFEDALLRAYNQSMEERRVEGLPTGGAWTGRRLHAALQRAGFQVLGAGSSDWNVFPWEGGYAGLQSLFLRSLLAMIAREGLSRAEIDPAELRRWYLRRLEEVEAGRLGLVTHQLDLLAVRS